MSQQNLSQDEVDALLQGMTGDVPVAETEGVRPPKGSVREYNLASEDRIVRGRMPMLEVINERFSRNVMPALTEFAQRNLEISVGEVKVQKYSAFLRETMVPTNFNVVSMRPLRGSALFVCDPTLIFAFIDALFGGVGKFPARIEGREFSGTEQRVIMRIVEILLREYNKAWQGIYPLELTYQRSEMQPQFVNIAAAGDVVVTTVFTIEIGESVGSVRVCIPYANVEPIRDVLRSNNQGEAPGADKRWISLLSDQIQSAEVELVAELAKAPATVEQLLAMKVGDFIELDLGKTIKAHVDGVPVLEAGYGTSGGHYAIRIERVLTNQQVSWIGDQNA
ncbi:flagellar motor switch protein FliM [Sphaerotilus natans subsp. natans DSM 6575]|uniref:Flagellar motor switch protein FliM n=1 Tax=Sphaerotilus natans subsp. natans DSM 6575 TaxID=1286631 RepID=A0A059KM85_9BURK|nr:flagellar motor switch protein FliM [Sphaerotilus natans]KDB52334.1 flagellar motor switch protein FliM [Sphaerotilus natans subsp. natans DSM 6575]SIS06456.1 flagellar motor switch protein FliM [Sphaerotilus natans]